MVIDNKTLKQSPLAEGGEGIIYNYEQDKVLKVYKNTANKIEKEAKIKILMTKSLPQSVISPIDIAYDNNGKFLGYIMRKIDGEDFKRLSSKKYVQMNKITSKDILKMLVEIKAILVVLHSQGIYIGDLNDNNVIFDKYFNVYFIDCDSWAIDQYPCAVCMDSFKDPLLKGTSFSSSTDSFAYAILSFKALAKIHPFGGTTNPDIDILQRMNKCMSVLGNHNITIPKTIPKWSFIAPKLIDDMKNIFESSTRFLLDQSMSEYYNNLKYCSTHNEYYFGKYNNCPLCDATAKVATTPVKITTTAQGMPMLLLFSHIDVDVLLSESTYLSKDGHVVHMRTGKKVKYIAGFKYYFSEDGSVLYTVSNRDVEVNINGMVSRFNKLSKSEVQVKDKCFYYVSLGNNLIEVTVTGKGNSERVLCNVAFTNIFEIYDSKNYFACSVYDNMIILNISGYNYVINKSVRISNYGLHYDVAQNKWLFIYEDYSGKFTTMVFDKNDVVYQDDSVKYTNNLSNMCFSGNVIFKPCDGAIRGFAYSKSAYKDFDCPVVNEDSKLTRDGNRFIVMNDKEIHRVG